jgi:hypothetical protein
VATELRRLFLDPKTAETYTFINSTTGARIAIERLADKIKWMRALRGQNVMPMIRLESRPMPTQYGKKMRPEFTPFDWLDITPAQVGSQPAAQLEHQPAEYPSVSENNGTVNSAAVTKAAVKKGKIAKPVEGPTLAEEIDDEIPWFGDPPKKAVGDN